MFQNKYGEITEFYFLRGLVYLDMQQTNMAQSDFRKAIVLATHLVNSRRLLVKILLDSEKFEEAITGLFEGDVLVTVESVCLSLSLAFLLWHSIDRV